MQEQAKMSENEARATGSVFVAPCMSRDFIHKLDGQNRMAIPSDWRGSGSGIFMLIPGKESTLQIYPESVFNERILSKLKKLSPANPDDLRKLRQLGSQIFTCECDRQGRIQLPLKLVEYAHLDGRAALIGSGDFGQIMNAARWEEEQKSQTLSGDAFLDILG